MEIAWRPDTNNSAQFCQLAAKNTVMISKMGYFRQGRLMVNTEKVEHCKLQFKSLGGPKKRLRFHDGWLFIWNVSYKI